MFFASGNDLVHRFDYAGDPDHVTVDLTDARIWDASAVAAEYAQRGKTVEDRAEAAVEHGAHLLLPPFEAGGQGRIATLLDPFGAAFSLWSPPPGRGWRFPPGTPGAPRRMLLACTDPSQARAFYRGFLGAAPAACDFLPTADPGPASWEAAIAVPDPAAVLALAGLDAPAAGPRLPSLSTPDGITFRLLPDGP